ncbi:outer membrane protein [Bosea thiooxidans]|nr:porin family protein [Bosea sp. (in: a-proteobacteria)]
MKKYLLASVAALGIIAAGAASAADLPSRKGPVAAPVYIPPVFTWTGFYVGANAGYGFGNVNTNVANNIGDLDGFVGGGQVGYNYQMGQFVLGLEADLQYADLNTGRNVFGDRVKTDYFGTVRARAGFAFDRFLPYITGGWAYGRTKTDIGTLAGVVSDENTHTGGWVIGGGLEYAFTNNIIAGVEYLYVDLGEKRVLNSGLKVGTDFSVVRARLSYKF